jgi:ribonuclease P protein component
MLPKQERLTKNREFVYVYHRKKSVANSLLILYVSNPRRNKDIPVRVGFVVGKNVSKKATKRNRAKRLMRAAYRELRRTEGFQMVDSQHLIFIAREGIIESDYKQVKEAIADLITRAAKRFPTTN